MPDRVDTAAFADLLSLLRDAERGFLARAGGNDADLAEGYANLLDLLSSGLDFYLRNDPEHPHFDPIVSPTRKIGGDNADARYHFAPLRGDRSYRIRGRRNGELYLGFTAYGGPAENESHIVANLGTEEIEFAPDGRYEVVISPRPKDDRAPNHLLLSPDTQSVIVREYFHELAAAAPVAFGIEPLDASPAPGPIGGEEMARRLRAVTAFVRGWTDLAPIPQPEDPAQYNTLIPPMRASASTGHWSTPDNIHAFGFYRLAPEEALVIEGRSPECVYWSCHLWSAYMRTNDYRYRQVWRNDAQVAPEPDGSWRLVVAHRDPGVPNWIDTSGRPTGFVYFRWLLARETPPPLAARVVKLSELS